MRASIAEQKMEHLARWLLTTQEKIINGQKKDPSNQKAYKAKRKCKVFSTLGHLRQF